MTHKRYSLSNGEDFNGLTRRMGILYEMVQDLRIVRQSEEVEALVVITKRTSSRAPTSFIKYWH